MTIDSQQLDASLRRLATRDADDAGAGVEDSLHEVAMACVDLFGVTGSGIMLADEADALHYVASSDGQGRLLEELEDATLEGPCTESFLHDRPVTTRDLHAEDRWPRLRDAVQGQDELRAVLGVPVRLRGIPVGTLDVFRDRPHEWDDTEQEALLRYAEVVGTTLSSALAAHRAGKQAAQLQYALDYRVVIERGVGYLMARDGLVAEDAFKQLRSTARNLRAKIGDVAQHLLDTGRLPES